MPEARFCALRECRPRRAALEVGGASQRPPPPPSPLARAHCAHLHSYIQALDTLLRTLWIQKKEKKEGTHNQGHRIFGLF